MPEYIVDDRPAFLDKEKVEILLKTLREYQEKTGVVITEFSIKTPVIIHGYIMDTEFTMKVNRE